ncbi:conjugal transfer protein TrbL family protein [Faecalispora anaeroviscerum]|uniref:conjugal transfer protein TrbL family protein n=1 Tax=Faecalispora anaeroviscerum TaxID=2991836 RepID=UPI0024BB0D91|nr:conjugal transfer protein TrbL family protein [Faecalispora anaeroviscerum]
MFIWDFVADKVLGQIMDWIYAQLVGFLGQFFAMMGNMGAELFNMSWVQAIVLFFSYLAWALYGTGLVVAVFECGIEYQSGRGSIKDTALNAIKGFMAVNLFNIVPVELYKLAVSLQGSFSSGITGMIGTSGGISTMSASALTNLGGLGLNPIMGIFIVILMGYAIIKVFFANLKRGGILLIQIAVGSLYMFSVPRGYIDGFVSWCKQVIGLCLTAFLQATILVAGLMVFNSNMLLGLGLMLASSEIPRIAGQFGLDTSTKANLMSTLYAAQSAVNITRTVVQAVAK